MEKNVEISILLQIYGKLLTDKQLQILEEYYNNDLSLSEIAQNNNITRQAVLDIIKKGENKLFEYEEKLLFMKRMLKNEKQINNILLEIKKIESNYSNEQINRVLEHVKKQLKCFSLE